MRSGYINVGIPALRYAGAVGHGWPSRSYSTATNAYYFYFTASDVGPSHHDNRWYGFPLRCLSTVLGMGGEGGLQRLCLLVFSNLC